MFESMELEKGGIVGILTRASCASIWFVPEFLNENSDKKILLLEDNDISRQCEKIMFNGEQDLSSKINKSLAEYDVVLINHMRDREDKNVITKILKKIKDGAFENTTFVLIFTSYTGKSDVKATDYDNLGEVVLSESELVYIVQRNGETLTFDKVKG